MLSKIKKNVETNVESLLSLGTGDRQRPQINKNFESNIKGLFIIGDLAGAPGYQAGNGTGI